MGMSTLTAERTEDAELRMNLIVFLWDLCG